MYRVNVAIYVLQKTLIFDLKKSKINEKQIVDFVDKKCLLKIQALSTV